MSRQPTSNERQSGTSKQTSHLRAHHAEKQRLRTEQTHKLHHSRLTSVGTAWSNLAFFFGLPADSAQALTSWDFFSVPSGWMPLDNFRSFWKQATALSIWSVSRRSNLCAWKVFSCRRENTHTAHRFGFPLGGSRRKAGRLSSVQKPTTE